MKESSFRSFLSAAKAQFLPKRCARGESFPSAGKESDNMRKIEVPNRLIYSRELTPSAKRVALAILTYQWEKPRKHHICKKLRYIAERAGVCVTTARAALNQLECEGFLTCRHSYCYSEEVGRVVYAESTYCVHGEKGKKYTLIPYITARKLLASSITHAQFVVYLFLASCQGAQNDHAWPALRYTAKCTDLSKATVCRAIIILSRVQFVNRRHCWNQRGCYSKNSYYVIVNVIWSPIAQGSNHHDYFTTALMQLQAPEVVSFLTNSPINNITGNYILRERNS